MKPTCWPAHCTADSQELGGRSLDKKARLALAGPMAAASTTLNAEGSMSIFSHGLGGRSLSKSPELHWRCAMSTETRCTGLHKRARDKMATGGWKGMGEVEVWGEVEERGEV